MAVNNRWGIAAAGILMQMALGAVYAWSVFRTPLTDRFHWSISQVTLTFTIAIFVLGVATFFGGLWLNKSGPRVVALTAGLLYGLGVFLASYSGIGLWWLYLTYGLIGGVGLGFGYIVPIAVLLKWFPDRRGLITGIAVGGFGAGALVVAPLATRMIQSIGVLHTFAWLGVGYFVVVVATGAFMRNPPPGWTPAGWTPSATQVKQRAATDYTLGGALKTWQWWALWLLLFLNVTAGISLISQEAPIFREIAKVTVLQAGIMVGIVSIGNALGRIFWAGLRLPDPPLDLHRHVSRPGLPLLDHALHDAGGHPRHDFLCRAHVLRRRLRHHARFHRGLLRLQKRRPHLRPDVDRVGLRQRLRASADCSHAPGQRVIRDRPAGHCGDHGCLCAASTGGSSAACAPDKAC